MKKGVAKQGHGRAENMNAAKTRGGAMDGSVRLQIASAINCGLIDKCNGVVKEGKEALVYHAEAGWRGRDADASVGASGNLAGESIDTDEVGSDGYDVAVKVFKRISEFKGRGAYVDGDPRFHRQKFKTNDQREQIVLWCEKEYRNLVRANRGGVPVPIPLKLQENVLFMRFLGENGWSSPQLREVELKKGSDKWTVLYLQTIAAIRR
jgi:RIO kinase 1